MQYMIGLTGLIGSGKSLVASIFSELGIDIIDTDAIAHALTCAGESGINAISEQFGPQFIAGDGSLNRVKMRELIFDQPAKRRRLESVLHPLIYSETLNQITRSQSKYVIVMVPLLFKALKYLKLIHRSLLVDCEKQVLVERVGIRSGLSANEVEEILKVQMSRFLQLRLCDDKVNNNGNIADLRQQVIKLNNKYIKLFEARI